MTRAAPDREPIPLTIVGGFLGAGKTTLINRLLGGGHGRRITVIVNDFGAIKIDASLIADRDDDVIALANGCVCCSLGSSLSATLMQVRSAPDPPDHVVIEASGVSEPAKIAQIGLAGLTVVMLVAVALTGYLVVTGGNADGPTDQRAVHEHGTMEITIDGQQLDLMSSEFAQSDSAFHFHGNEQQKYGDYVWHKHARGVTLQYALETLGIEVNDAGTELTYDGTTYSEDDGASIDIEVDGEAVEPADHEVGGVADETAAANGGGQDITVTVTTGN
jgi:hypothetical protein